ncbi:putative NADH-cytochrome b5 reductase [Martensiomyces pterosporus]|nr:putative NADH-cytochrome b5 reductase [Martensiomyces pterosporus]
MAVIGSIAIVGAGAAAFGFLNNKREDTTLSRLGFTPIRLQSSEQLTHDVKRLRFSLDQDKKLGFTTSSAVVFRIKTTDGKTVIRPYTPVSSEDQKGSCEFVIKRYEGGKASTHMHKMSPGDQVEVWGPLPFARYTPGKYKDVGLIAGGTGLTPVYQLISRIVGDPEDRTRVTLLFANKTKDDIFMSEELDKLADEHPDRFTVHYVLGTAPEGWAGETGYVNAGLIEKYMPPAGPSTFIGVCGPPAMVTAISGAKPAPIAQGRLGGILKELGYENVYKF